MPSVDMLRGQLVNERIDQVEVRLGESAQLPPALLHAWVLDAWSRYEHARVHAYVPILVERTVRARIDGLPVGEDRWAAGGLPLRTWAWRLAERLLAEELPRRWAHSRGVARRAAQIAAAFPVKEQEILVASAWLHDIGYATPVRDTGLHQLDGARYLARRGVPWRVCALVAHHAGAAAVAELVELGDDLALFADERGPTRDALWYCDMTTSPDGELVGFADRMAELRRRRAADDPVVRGLAVNGAERAAAVRRTEYRLLHQG